MTCIEHRHIAVPQGEIHCAIAGTGRPVLLLHQTPRSWDEYRDVLPLLSEGYRAIAMDTIGFGDSSKPSLEADSIENWAEAAVSLLDALEIQTASVVGHHTGAVIAIELAAAYPERVRAAVLSSAPFIKSKPADHPRRRSPVDDVERRPDGSHVLELWRLRQPFYPEGDMDLLERFIIDALKAGPRAAGGHYTVSNYEMEARLPLVRCPVLLISAPADPHAFPSVPLLAARLPMAKIVEIDGGMVPLVDQLPEAFASVVSGFLNEIESTGSMES